MHRPYVLEAINIDKRFGDLQALQQVSLHLRKGSMHALLGENGAGKSTLVKCIMGYYKPDGGHLVVHNRETEVTNPEQAKALGIGMVYQHFTLIPNMNITENIVLSRPNLPAVIDWKWEQAKLETRMADMPFKFDLKRSVNSLSAGEKQKVEIIKQLLLDTQVLILDEPTSVLTPGEADEVLDKIHALTRASGLSVLMITHKFREVTKYADEVTVLRKGRFAGAAETQATTPRQLATMMVGEEILTQPPQRGQCAGPVQRLRIEGLKVENDQGRVVIDGLDLELRSGEIVGIAGVSGNGQKQLTEVLGGQRKPLAGRMLVNGSEYTGTRAQMHEQRFHCLPEEPLRNGCVGNLSIADNLVLRDFDSAQFARLGVVLNRGSIRAHAVNLITQFGIRTYGPSQQVRELSGGNVQRVVLARELSEKLAVLVIANPCFGLDFKAVADIRARIMAARNSGTAVLLLSEDLDEILELSDRFYVMSGGALVYQTTPHAADLNTVGQYMGGH